MPITSARTGFHFAAPVAVLVVLSSCALESHDRGAPGPVSSSLSESQLSGTLASTAYDAIQQLHPIALNLGGAMSREPTVYLDGMSLGGVAELRRIAAAGLTEIRFLNSVEASARFGSAQRGGGAILLTSKVWRAATTQ